MRKCKLVSKHGSCADIICRRQATAEGPLSGKQAQKFQGSPET